MEAAPDEPSVPPARATGESFVLGVRCADDASVAFAACLRSTYRRGMKGGPGAAFDRPTTDQGFGCTVRSAQSLLMNLCRPSSSVDSDMDEARLRFACAFADGWEADGHSLSFFSCLAAPGAPSAWWVWWGAWQAVTTLVALRSAMRAPLPGPPMLAATDGVITAAAVRAAAGVIGPEPSAGQGWPSPVVIFIPVSLGFSTDQRKDRLRDLAELAATPLFAGAVGGRKDHSVAYVGVRFKGEPEGGGFELLTLDPHTTQECVPYPAGEDAHAACGRYLASLCPPPLGSPGTVMDPEVVSHTLALAARVVCEEDLANPLLLRFLSVVEGDDAGACASW